MAGSSSPLLRIPSPQNTRHARLLPERVVRQTLEQGVARVFTVPIGDLWSQTRGRPSAAFARQVAMYLAHVCFGLSLKEVGEVFGRDRTTVAHACGVVEDRRDDPSLDRALELLEGVLRFLSSTNHRVS